MKILIKTKTKTEEARCPLLRECEKAFVPRPCSDEWCEYESIQYSRRAPCCCTPTLEYSDGDEGDKLLDLLETDFSKTHKHEPCL